MIDRFSPFLVSYSLNLLLNYQIKPALLNQLSLFNRKKQASKAHITSDEGIFPAYVCGRNNSSAAVYCLL